MSENVMEKWSRFAKVYDPIKIGSIDGTDTEPHDKAIIRALNSHYRPNKFVKGRPECTIFVSRLSPKTTKDTIKDAFSRYGRLKRFRLVRDIVTGMPKGYAFIEYETEAAAEEAYRRANKLNLDGNVIFVDFECERLLKGWKPRRLGGGFGGKKESGQLRFGGRDRPFIKPISVEVKEQDKNKEYEKLHFREKSKEHKRRKEVSEERDQRHHKGRRRSRERRRHRSRSHNRDRAKSRDHSKQDKYEMDAAAGLPTEISTVRGENDERHERGKRQTSFEEESPEESATGNDREDIFERGVQYEEQSDARVCSEVYEMWEKIGRDEEKEDFLGENESDCKLHKNKEVIDMFAEDFPT